jgi:hypothetical protein
MSNISCATARTVPGTAEPPLRGPGGSGGCWLNRHGQHVWICRRAAVMCLAYLRASAFLQSRCGPAICEFGQHKQGSQSQTVKQQVMGDARRGSASDQGTAMCFANAAQNLAGSLCYRLGKVQPALVGQPASASNAKAVSCAPLILLVPTQATILGPYRLLCRLADMDALNLTLVAH